MVPEGGIFRNCGATKAQQWRNWAERWPPSGTAVYVARNCSTAGASCALI